MLLDTISRLVVTKIKFGTKNMIKWTHLVGCYLFSAQKEEVENPELTLNNFDHYVYSSLYVKTL